MLDKYYIVSIGQRYYEQNEIDEIKDIKVPEELLQKEVDKLLELEGVLCMGLDKGKTTEDIRERLVEGQEYDLIQDMGYVQIWDNQGKIIGISDEKLKYYRKIKVSEIYDVNKRSLYLRGTAIASKGGERRGNLITFLLKLILFEKESCEYK